MPGCSVRDKGPRSPSLSEPCPVSRSGNTRYLSRDVPGGLASRSAKTAQKIFLYGIDRWKIIPIVKVCFSGMLPVEVFPEKKNQSIF